LDHSSLATHGFGDPPLLASRVPRGTWSIQHLQDLAFLLSSDEVGAISQPSWDLRLGSNFHVAFSPSPEMGFSPKWLCFHWANCQYCDETSLKPWDLGPTIFGQLEVSFCLLWALQPGAKLGHGCAPGSLRVGTPFMAGKSHIFNGGLVRWENHSTRWGMIHRLYMMVHHGTMNSWGSMILSY